MGHIWGCEIYDWKDTFRRNRHDLMNYHTFQSITYINNQFSMIYKVTLLTNLFIRVLIKPRICIKQRQHICVPIDCFFLNLILLKEKIPHIPWYSNRPETTLIQLYLIKVSMIKIELSLFIHLIPTVDFYVRFIVMSLINLIINYRGIK